MCDISGDILEYTSYRQTNIQIDKHTDRQTYIMLFYNKEEKENDKNLQLNCVYLHAQLIWDLKSLIG